MVVTGGGAASYERGNAVGRILQGWTSPPRVWRMGLGIDRKKHLCSLDSKTHSRPCLYSRTRFDGPIWALVLENKLSRRIETNPRTGLGLMCTTHQAAKGILPDYDNPSVSVSVGTPLSLYGIAYRRAFGVSTGGSFKRPL